MGREKRFHEECEADVRKTVPHFYLKDDKIFRSTQGVSGFEKAN